MSISIDPSASGADASQFLNRTHPGVHPNALARIPATEAGPSRTDLDPHALMGNAAEELTFQFSEAVEAEAHALEARLSTDEAMSTDDISIQQVHRILRILEGREGHAQLRSQARSFARAYGEGQADAFDLLAPESFKPEHRYAMMRLASEALEMAGQRDDTGQLERSMKALAGTHGDELRRFFELMSKKGTGWSESTDVADASNAFHDPYFQLLATKPTVRSMFDTAAERQSMSDMGATLAMMQRAWARQTNRAEQIGAFVVLSRLAGIVQTMLFFARDLAAHAGSADTPAAAHHKHARSLIDLANSSVPGGLLDKLATSLLPQAGKDTRTRFFSFLHRQVRQWPDPIWVSPDSKAMVLQQLVNRQQLPRDPNSPRIR